MGNVSQGEWPAPKSETAKPGKTEKSAPVESVDADVTE